MIWLYNPLTMSVPDQGYSYNPLTMSVIPEMCHYTLNYISMFLSNQSIRKTCTVVPFL
jgi:hypothetical protein